MTEEKKKMIAESIRLGDWNTALRSVNKGTSLSALIHWSFSDDDIRKLAELHKANKFRRKIEDLLDDCNFHYESTKFSHGEYAEFLLEPSQIILGVFKPVFVYLEYNDSKYFGERLVATFQKEKDAVAFLRERVKKCYEDYPDKLKTCDEFKSDVISDKYVAIRNDGGDTSFFVIDECNLQ